MKAYTTKQSHRRRDGYPRFAHVNILTFPAYPKYVVKEKIWENGDKTLHRFYINHQYIGDMIGNDGFIRVDGYHAYIEGHTGHEYVKVCIK